MQDASEHYQFDVQKFKDVVHYIVHHVESKIGSEYLGNTKLHKVLYYSDFLTFLERMAPLTGAEYQRQKFGPTARYLTAALNHLKAEGRVSVEDINYFGFPKKEYRSLAAPETSRLSDREKDLIAYVANFVCQKTAVEISEFSHDAVWSSVPMGSSIPYFAAFAMFPAVYTDEDIQAAQSEINAIAYAT